MSDKTKPVDNEKVVNITPEAMTELKRLLSQESDEDVFLRIGVAAGGCSGMSYSLAFDNKIAEHDQQYEYDGVKVVLDTRAIPYLNSSTLDYKGGLLGGGFHFQNPNARRSCGCGSSFTC
jgi:iron-sulfur cluster assembly protein